jgi:hypothetical protein
MKLNNKDLMYVYSLANKRYFKKKLPKNLLVKFAKIKPLGKTRFMHPCSRCNECQRLKVKYAKEMKRGWIPIEILIDNKLKSCSTHAIVTLLHEMVHVSIGGGYQHGSRFYKELDRIWKAKAFRGLV